ncbi:MAG TPA: response regulator [Chitinophagaceae bacterium]|nr:response regulator [Chitinophagaceae bacterium]
MAKAGPLVIIEDDIDDQKILDDVLKELNIENELIKFTNSFDAFKYLKSTPDQPFLILCDVNLPGQSGIEFKWNIDNDMHLRKKSIPFVFLSTSADQKSINDAYTKMTVQGYYKKPNTYNELKDIIKLIMDYWRACKHPNTE